MFSSCYLTPFYWSGHKFSASYGESGFVYKNSTKAMLIYWLAHFFVFSSQTRYCMKYYFIREKTIRKKKLIIRIIITIHYRCNYKEIVSNYSSSSKIEGEQQLVLLLAAWRLLLFNILGGKTAWLAIKSETSIKKDKYTNFSGVWEKYFSWCLTADQSASLQITFETYFPISVFKIMFQLLLSSCRSWYLKYKTFLLYRPKARKVMLQEKGMLSSTEK